MNNQKFAERGMAQDYAAQVMTLQDRTDVIIAIGHRPGKGITGCETSAAYSNRFHDYIFQNMKDEVIQHHTELQAKLQAILDS